MNKLAFAVAAVLACTSVSAQDAPVFVQTVCFKVDPPKVAAYETFLRNTIVKGMQALVQSGDVAWFVYSRNIIPVGEAAPCDYVGAIATRGFPSEPTQPRVGGAVTKAVPNTTLEHYRETITSLRRQITNSLLVTVNAMGEIAEGDYYRVNYMKIKPNMSTAWRELEQKTWGPIQGQRIKDGQLKAWHAYLQLLPTGSSHPYDAVTIDVYRSFGAMGQPNDITEVIKKVHPKMKPEDFNEKTGAARDLVNSELRQAIIVLGNTKM